MLEQVGELVNFAYWIEGIAAMAGLEAERLSDELVAINYVLLDGRTQVVWVNPIGRDPMGNTIVGISAPAMKVGKGHLLPRQVTNNLLRENSKMYHSAWSIELIEGDEYLVVFDTQIAETMDTKEFSASVQVCAILADDWKKKLDRDSLI